MTTPKERPILLSAPMVRAILAGTKTQTRRVMKTQPPSWAIDFCTYYHPKVDGVAHYAFDPVERELQDWSAVCPFGQLGDRLWVRETWRADAHYLDGRPPRDIPSGSFVAYEAGLQEVPFPAAMGRLRPGMFMPRWASRITLEVTDVRIERLQDISESDAIAEGVESYALDGKPSISDALNLPAAYFRYLWDHINGQGAWDENPWVWAITFKRIEP